MCDTEYSSLLETYDMWTGKYLPTFQGTVMPSYAGLFNPKDEGITILRKVDNN
jgi:hypothetical protein